MATTEAYPTPLHADKEEFPTPVEAAKKGLNPNPPPLETGLSDMPELPELTHANDHGHAATAEGAHTNGITSTDKKENSVATTTTTNLPPSAGETEPKYADVASAKGVKSRAKSAAKKAQAKKEELRAEAAARGWPTTWSDAWDKYWIVGTVVGVAAVAVGVTAVVRSRPDWVAWLKRK
ncbi:hypothetical protein SpCBS45565_g07307 [Spizellomyces sp. 'palustris']|nr:hypothetical protein SpCBS45565_g07307 [Spizellomyces sp. 'palustris']